MTRKEQKEEKKNAILMTALQLFVEKGYQDTKITDIAKAVPMSTGLLFHYFDSKEDLLLELVKMGTQGPASFGAGPEISPDLYFTEFLKQIFTYAKEQPWVFHMFVLMGMVRHPGMPKEARELAGSVDVLAPTVRMIRKGQRQGVFHKGNSETMAKCFWASVQGIMEMMAGDKTMTAPKPEWIVAMLK